VWSVPSQGHGEYKVNPIQKRYDAHALVTNAETRWKHWTAYNRAWAPSIVLEFGGPYFGEAS